MISLSYWVMPTKVPPEGVEIKVKYTRAPDIRELRVDGAFGGVTYDGEVTMAVYTERLALPDSATVTLVPDPDAPNGLKITDRPKGPGGNERILQAVLHFDLDTARSLRTWLDDKITAVEANK